MIMIVRFSDLSMGIFDSVFYVTEVVFVDSEAILKAWIIDMTILTIVSNMVVFEKTIYMMALFKKAVYMMVVSEIAISGVALLESVIVNS